MWLRLCWLFERQICRQVVPLDRVLLGPLFPSPHCPWSGLTMDSCNLAKSGFCRHYGLENGGIIWTVIKLFSVHLTTKRRVSKGVRFLSHAVFLLYFFSKHHCPTIVGALLALEALQSQGCAEKKKCRSNIRARWSKYGQGKDRNAYQYHNRVKDQKGDYERSHCSRFQVIFFSSRVLWRWWLWRWPGISKQRMQIPRKIMRWFHLLPMH